MIRTYENLKHIIGETRAKKLIRFLVDYMNVYITYEEIQQLNI